MIYGASIRFVNLGLEIKNVGRGFSVLGIDIYYYGVIVAIAIMVGMFLAFREAKITGQNVDDYVDFAMYVIILSIAGARIYYVIFEWDSYKDNLVEIITGIRHGGLAIYGAIIAAVITCIVYTRLKKLSFWRMADTACIGLISGQIIGRWGNFFNREAFGGYTDNLFAMQIRMSDVSVSMITESIRNNIKVVNGIEYIQVHPTFLYESLWNLFVLILILIFRKHKKYNGEVFLWYIAGYALGRAWIEGLRTDQLLVLGLPVSQLLSVILAISAIAFMAYKRFSFQKD